LIAIVVSSQLIGSSSTNLMMVVILRTNGRTPGSRLVCVVNWTWILSASCPSSWWRPFLFELYCSM